MRWTLFLQPDQAPSCSSLERAIASHKASLWPAVSPSRTLRDCQLEAVKNFTEGVASKAAGQITAACSCL